MNNELKWLRILLTFESFFGFSRQFVILGVRVKVFVLIRILVEIALAFCSLHQIKSTTIIIEATLLNIVVFVSLLLSFHYSKQYVRFVDIINIFHMKFKVDILYRCRVNKILKLGTYLWFGYLLLLCGLVISLLYVNSNFYKLYNTAPLVVINNCLITLRFHLECVMLYITLCNLSEQLQCIERSVKNTTENINGVKNLTNIFEEWRQDYLKIKKCCSTFNKLYGMQIDLNTFLFVTHYIVMFYKMVGIGVNKGISTYSDWVGVTMLYVMSLYSVTFVTTRAAQNLQNNANKFTCGLQRLLVQMYLYTGNTDEKRLKQLLKEVSTRPIHIKSFGAISFNMTLVPACVSVITSYTVIALQFDNVI